MGDRPAGRVQHDAGQHRGAITSREPAKVLAYSTVANMGYAMAALTIFFVHGGAGEAALAYALLGLLAQLLVNGAGKIGLFSIIGNERGDLGGATYWPTHS